MRGFVAIGRQAHTVGGRTEPATDSAVPRRGTASQVGTVTPQQLPTSTTPPGSVAPGVVAHGAVVASVLVVGDRALFTDSLEIALRAAGYDVQRVPTICPAAAVTAPTVGPYPRIALVDADHEPFGDGGELIEPLARVGIAVVVLADSLDRGQWGGFVRRGARCVLAKSAPLPELLSALRLLSQGRPVMTQQERTELIEWWRRDREDVDLLRERFRRLTPREQQVLADLTEGLAIHDIAVEDVVSEATVRTQVKSILRKLEVPSQLGAVALAHRLLGENASV
jgi:two-component system, NarL family, nitrate/nitrite response regulator NarL